MNALDVVNHLVTILSGQVSTSVVSTFSTDFTPGESQILVSGTSEPMVFDSRGKPQCFKIDITFLVVSHVDDDSNGSIRRAHLDDILSWLISLTVSTVSITGYQCDAITDISTVATAPFGESYVSNGFSISLVYQKTV
jgi:hypothetical protein